MIFEMMMSYECFHIISFVVWTFRDDENCFKRGYFCNDFRQSFDEVDQSFGNTWPSEKESEKIFFQMIFFSDRLDIAISKMFFVPMVIIHAIVYRN